MMYLSRNKIYNKVALAKDAKKIYIFCEGKEREVTYFKYFKGISTNIDIIPIPPVEGQSDPEKLKQNAGANPASLLFRAGHNHHLQQW